jgi:hypothetical protein
LSGQWTQLTNQIPTGSAGTMLLLPNGDVMVQGANDASVATWFELKPDSTGSYANGTWTQLASMGLGRLFFGSAVMPSDKVFVVGGEYTGPNTNPTDDNTGEIYDMATNTWSSIPNFPEPNFGDDPTVTLPNGDILGGYLAGPQTFFYDPTTNSWSPAATKLDNDASDEETWIKLPVSATLPEGGILSWSIFASIDSNTFMGQVYNIATNQWIETQNSTTDPPSLLSSPAIGFELGGGVMLPNGKALLLGANGNSALYDPSTNTWSAGPQIKDANGNLLGPDDAPASILPDGQVVFSADFGPTSGTFSPPTELFDYDYTTNKITQIPAATLPNTLQTDLNNSAFVDRTLVLPNGQLLFNDSTNLFVFTAFDSPQNAWRPSISSVIKNSPTSYTVTGLQLSGLSEGSSYGDDVNVSENYPILQLRSSSGQVFYETTSNWSNVLVSPVGDATLESFDFTLPTNFATGTYQLRVIANGIASNPQNFVVAKTSVTTVAQSPAPVTFSTNNQTVQLKANVSVVGGGPAVNVGTVTFTVMDSKSNVIGNPVIGSVTSGTASVNFTLPGNTPAGSYTISVSYTDGTNTFVDKGDTGATLTVNTASATSKAVTLSTNYSPKQQSLLLTANVSDTSIPGDTVNEGIVTFTVKDSSSNTVGTTTGAVINGAASGSFAVPAGTPPGTYTVFVSYNDSLGNFTDNVPGDTSATLTINTAKVLTTADSFSVAYNRLGQSNVLLSANVVDASVGTDTVPEGTVKFTVKDSGGNTIGTAQGSVSGGTTSTNLDLPAGLTGGNYTIAVSYSDSLGNFTDGGDTSGTITVLPDLVSATAGPANITFSTAAQPLALTAAVTNDVFSTDIVNEGTVTFTILNSSNKVIGNAFGNVTSGTANATFTWAAGQPAGAYTITVSYADNQGNYADDGLDFASTLNVSAASVTTTANSLPPIIVSSNSQTITLSATVADTSFPSDIVSEGTVTFTLKNSGGTTVGTAQGSVSGGAASASFSVPGGQAVGLYTIVASYSDSLKNFSDNGSSDTPGTFTIAPANVITTASNASATYSPSSQTLKLSASIANSSVPANTVSEGTVTFTIKNGSTIIGTAQGSVSGGATTANFNLPAGQATGSYTIAVSYSDNAGSGNFTDAGDNNAVLTITPANVTVTANKVSTAYSLKPQTVALSATVTDTSIPGDMVSEGTVTFTIKNGSTIIGTAPGTVTAGTANANFNLPAGQAIGTYTIGVSYSDSSGNILDTGDTSSTLTITPANVTVQANNIPAVYNSSKDQTLSLSATVTDASVPTDSVPGGMVTFTVKSGSTLVGSVQGNVIGGTATANFNLPAGQASGNYTITVSYSDGTGHFLDIGDTSGTLTVAAANVTTTASNLSAAFSPNARTLSLSATVANTSNPLDTVSQGIVTFTVTQGSTTIGTATGLVSSGKATAGFTLPAGQALGTYIIGVSYSNSAGNFTDSGDTAGVLTVSPANVTTTANNVSTDYSLNAQTVTLSANVTNASVPGDTVVGGIVTFTIKNGSSVLGSGQGTVTNGTASTTVSLSAGFTSGNYTIAVSYNDTQGRYLDSGDTSGTLAVKPTSVTTLAASTSTTYSPGAQTLVLSAAVTDPGPAISTVSEGIVTFTIKAGSAVLGSVQGGVNNGMASANFNLPPGQAAGNYSIVVSYSDVGGNFADTGDTGGTLSVGTANSTTQLIVAAISPNYTNLTVTEFLVAHVTSNAAPVTSGTVTFAFSGTTKTVNVDGNGVAAVTVTLPMLTLLGPQSISVSYADPANNLRPSSDAETATWQESNPLIPTTTEFTDKGEVLAIDLFGLVITFTNGVLTEIDFDGIDLVFSYSTTGQLIGATVDGMNLLF